MSVALGRHAFYGWVHLCGGGCSPRDARFEGLRRALQGWAKMILDVVRDPVAEELAFQVGFRLLQQGRVSSATALALQMWTYARPSEALAIRFEDVLAARRRQGR